MAILTSSCICALKHDYERSYTLHTQLTNMPCHSMLDIHRISKGKYAKNSYSTEKSMCECKCPHTFTQACAAVNVCEHCLQNCLRTRMGQVATDNRGLPSQLTIHITHNTFWPYMGMFSKSMTVTAVLGRWCLANTKLYVLLTGHLNFIAIGPLLQEIYSFVFG